MNKKISFCLIANRVLYVPSAMIQERKGKRVMKSKSSKTERLRFTSLNLMQTVKVATLMS